MTDKELKDCWRNNSMCGDNMNVSDAESIMDGTRKTALMRLAKRYKRFFRLGLLMAVYCPLTYLFCKGLEITDEWKIILAIYLTLFFLLSSVLDWVLYKKVEDINVISMSTQEVIDRARSCRRFHFHCMMILMPLSLLFIGTMLWLFFNDIYMVAVILVSLVVGLAIGLTKLSEFLRDYRSLSAD